MKYSMALLAFFLLPMAVLSQTIDENLWVTNGTVNAVARSGNTIYIGGQFTQVGPATGCAVPFDLNTGTLATGFPKVNGEVRAIVPDGAGGWYIGGSFTAVGAVYRNNLAHINPGNSVDLSWNPNANYSVRALAVSGSTIYAGGEFTTVGGQTRNRIAAIDATTGSVTSWNPNANNYVYALAVSGSTIYAGGNFTAIGAASRNRIAAIDASTGNATPWNPVADNSVFVLAISGTTVYAGGWFTSVGGQTRNRIAALDGTTGLATTWNPNASGSVYSLVLSGSTAYAGGDFTSIGGQTRAYIAALDATTGLATTWNPNASYYGFVRTLAISGSTVYVGGDFESIGGQTRAYIAALDATTGLATTWNPSASKPVYALAISGGILYAGGAFTILGGQARRNIAAFDASTGIATSWNPSASSTVRAIAISGSTTFVGGDFTVIGGQTRNRIAALDAVTGVPTAWNPNANSGVYVIVLDGSTVYVGGGFNSIGGQTRSGIAALDATTGLATSWNPYAINGGALAIALDGSTMYVVGAFTNIGGQARNRVAALDVTTGLATGWNPNANGTVNALAVAGTTVYVGGQFYTIGGQTRSGIAALSAVTGLATTWNPNVNGDVYGIALSGSTVFAGGGFNAVGGQPRKYLAALDVTTGTLKPSYPVPNNYIYSLSISGSTLYAGGNFLGMGTTAQSSISAIAVPNTYTLTVNATNGIVAKNPDLPSYNHGTSVELTATPAVGYHFVNWSGDASGSANPLTVTMDGNKTITANFALNTYSLTVNATNGAVAKNPDQPSYNHGASVELTATPAAGYHFVSWSGDATGSANPLTVTMDGNKTITANFAINTYTLTYNAGAGGSIVGTNPQLVNHSGNGTLVTATPDLGYHFVSWSDAYPTAGRTDLSVTADLIVTANFAINTYSLAVNAINGTVSKNPDLPSYNHGTGVELTATPSAGYHFVNWSGDASGSTNPLSVTMDGNKAITANFAINSYTLAYTANAGGSIVGTTPQTVNHGGNGALVTATPEAGYHFVSWSDGYLTAARTDLNVTADLTVTANFAINVYTLTYIAGAGGSIVGTTPQTVNHGDNGTLVTATPDAGYHFVGWSDASPTAARTDLNVTANLTVTATFTQDEYTLTVNVVGSGSVSRDNPGPYRYGDVVQLTPTASAGWTFSNFTPASPVTITGNTTVTATFTQDEYTLTVNVVGSGSVSRDNPGPYRYGDVVQLTPTAAAGWTFSNFTPASPVTITGNLTVTATFTQDEYTLTVNVVGSGNVSRDNPGPYRYGDVVQLTPTPTAGYSFVSWSGDASGSASPLTVTMIGNKNITANFAINSYTLTYNPTAGGSIVGTTPQTVNHGGNGTLVTATPEAGYHFISWSDAYPTAARTDLNVTADLTVTANFAINAYLLTVNATNGTVTKNPDLPSYNHGTSVQLTATPAIGYSFVSWSGDASGSANPLTVTMGGNKTITANFALNTYTLTVNATNGSVAKNPDQPSYNHGTSVQLTATPATGYSFVSWSGDATGSTNPLTVTMDGNKTITANFVINTYSLTVNATNGTVAKNPDLPSYEHGTNVQLTATPATGYSFVSWSGDATGSTNPLTVTMDGNKTITANFTINTYLLTVNATNGTVAKNPDLPSYNHGTSVQLTATPATGYSFVSWSGDATGSTNPLTVTMDGNKTITANFAINTYALTVTATNGSVVKNPDLVSYNHGASVELAATPAAGYHFVNWSGDASGSANPLTVTMDGNKTITANFALNSYSLTVNSSNGTVAKNPDQPSYNHGASVELTATPAAGYHFVNWSGDASGSANPLTVTMDGNKTITANFAINTYALTVNATNGTVAKVPDLGTYDHGTSVELTATPAAGYHFVNWSGDATGSTNPLTVTMDGNKTITANFVLNPVGSIAGNVNVNGVGLANVVVKLLDSDGNYIPSFPAIVTNIAGAYSFMDVPSGSDYQVMIVEPLGYTVDENPKLVTLSGTSITINFALTQQVITNRARGVSYWKHQFDEHRCGRMQCEETEADLIGYIAAVHEHYDPHFDFFEALTTLNQWGDVLTVGARSTARDRAKEQLAALLMNLVSLKIGQYTVVTADNRTAGDVLTYVSILISNNTPADDDRARTLASKVNNRAMIPAGVIPAGNILYRGGGMRQINWGFDLPKEFALHQNFPNPFNPSTTIRYDLPADGLVLLSVFNCLGQQVAVLVDEYLRSGRYQTEWNASGQASGVYFYRIHSSTGVATKKLLILR